MSNSRVPRQKANAAAVIGWLLAKDRAGNPYANARRPGVMYVIWNRDHIHFSLSWVGAMGRTSFWTRTVAAPDYGPCRVVGLNWAAQSVLRIGADGKFGPITEAKVQAFQKAHGLSQSGVVTAPVWRAFG